ncbi:MAG: HAMP domain-containing protein, partial [Coleofasciculaceae cyanobacterium SM2_1_6]|nr:HAMP domain-containing protein [Coleofasciculaceae cyanobacterium SM2_1_6]
MLRWNLSTKVVAAYSGLIALMAGVLTTTLYWQLRSANHKAMNDRLSDLLSLTAPGIDSDYHSLTLTPKDKNKPYYKINLRKLQTVQANSKDINRIYTLRPKKSGELAFVLNFSPKSKKSISVGETVQNLTPILAAEASTLSETKIENDFLQNPEGETVLYGYAPIKDQFGRLEGILAIELDASSIVQTELIGGVIALGTFLVILALTVLIVNWLARSLIVNPTLRLNDAAKKLAAGDWHQSLATESEDELGELAKSFNYMAQQLQNSFKKLEEYSQNLEQKVKERTTELQEKNQHLQQTQLQLIQAEKMSALGQMVAGIAHEINNPVGFITGNISHTREYFQYLLDLLSLYEQECPHPSPVLQSQMEAIDLNFLKDDLDKILLSMKTGCDRIRQVVLGLRNFSRLDESAQKQVNIHE